MPVLLAGEAARKVLHEKTVRLGGDCELACGLLDRQISCIALKLPVSLRSRGRNLLLGSSENPLLLLFDGGLNTLLVLRDILLGLRTHGGNLLVELAQPSLDARKPCARLFGRRAGLNEVLLDGRRAIAEDLRQSLDQEPGDQNRKNSEVDELKSGRCLLGIEPELRSNRLDRIRVTEGVVLVLLLLILLGRLRLRGARLISR